MIIRPASLDDAAALVPLFEHWGHPLSAAEAAQVLASWAATPSSAVLVADDDGRLAGAAAITSTPRFADPGRNAVLAGLVVADTHRRHGVGAALLDAAEAKAREWGCVRVELTSSRWRDAAHAFYPARGYRDTSAEQARYVRPLSPGAPS